MPVHIGELKLVTKLTNAVSDFKDNRAASKNKSQVSNEDNEALIRECIRRVMEMLDYKLH